MTIYVDDFKKKQPALHKLLCVLLHNYKRPMSTIELQRKGVLSPASGIARLKKNRVLVETTYQSTVDRFGITRKRVAFYKIVGVQAP